MPSKDPNVSPKVATTQISAHYDASAKVVLYNGLAEEFLRHIPTASVDLIATSPPYNMGKEYEESSGLDEYLAQQAATIQDLCRITSETGSICWQVGNYVSRGEVYPLDIYYYSIFKNLGMQLRNRIIWHYGHGLHATSRFSGRYETILWFTKTSKYKFNLDPVRVPAKYPGKRFSKGERKGELSGNPKGKNPSDVWEIMSEQWHEAVWSIPNVKAKHPEKTHHPCQFPVELVERCVLALTNEGDTVLDPYMGVGSALIAALKHGRRALGSEKEEKYVVTARERIEKLFNGVLSTRPLGQPLYIPDPATRVAQIPDEWLTDENTIYYKGDEPHSQVAAD